MAKKDKTKTKVSQLDVEVHLDIPDDEIWTYKIEGLAEPHINKPFKKAALKKIALVMTIIVAVSLSMFFSIYSVVQSTDTEFEANGNGGYTITRYSDKEKVPLSEIDINYTFEIKDGKQVDNLDQPITKIGAFAFNESPVKVVKIGANVTEIDDNAFYSCWSLERIEVDENNPNYSDIDGVLYNKDQTVIINYPCNHDQYLRVKYGYDIPEEDKTNPDDFKDKNEKTEAQKKRDAENKKYREPYRVETSEEYAERRGDGFTLEQYEVDIQTYVVPSTVVAVNELAFAYTNLREIYLPEGLTNIETCGFFKIHEPNNEWGNTDSLNNIYTYKADYTPDESARYNSKADLEAELGEIYPSLPEGLTTIGSDAFSYNKELRYIYIPESVTEIGHHAFYWECSGNNTELICTPLSEDAFNNITTGDQWRPQYDKVLFKTGVGIKYSAERAAMPAE